MTLRVLKALRLSKAADASTSIERQDERVTWWADGHGHEIVGRAEDVGVSGAVAPFDRPGLGPWLTDNPPAEWDVLVAWKLDRISRSAGDTYDLLRWCEDRGKRIVCVDDSIDTSTGPGRIFIQISAIMAEVERNAIKERILSSRDKLRRDGRWPAGTPPFGLVATPKEDGGYTLVHDMSCALKDCGGTDCPESHSAFYFARSIVESYISGDTMRAIAERLNSQGVLSTWDLRARQKGREPSDRLWRGNSIRYFLESPALRGYLPHQGQPMYGDDGLPIPSGDRIMTEAEWKEIEARQKDNPRPKFRAESPLLAGILHCGKCGKRMHSAAERRGVKRDGTPKEYRWYRCHPCKLRIRHDTIHQWAEALFLDEVGDLEQTEEKLLPGNHTSARLEEAQNAFEALVSQAGTMRSKAARKKLQEQLDSLDKLIAELEEQEDTPDRTVRVGTGTTFRDAWETDTSVEGRRKMLLDAGVKITLESGRPFSADFYVDLNKLRDFIGREQFEKMAY